MIMRGSVEVGKNKKFEVSRINQSSVLERKERRGAVEKFPGSKFLRQTPAGQNDQHASHKGFSRGVEENY